MRHITKDYQDLQTTWFDLKLNKNKDKIILTLTF